MDAVGFLRGRPILYQDNQSDIIEVILSCKHLFVPFCRILQCQAGPTVEQERYESVSIFLARQCRSRGTCKFRPAQSPRFPPQHTTSSPSLVLGIIGAVRRRGRPPQKHRCYQQHHCFQFLRLHRDYWHIHHKEFLPLTVAPPVGQDIRWCSSACMPPAGSVATAGYLPYKLKGLDN